MQGTINAAGIEEAQEFADEERYSGQSFVQPESRTRPSWESPVYHPPSSVFEGAIVDPSYDK